MPATSSRSLSRSRPSSADFLPAMYGKWQDQLYGIGRGEDAVGLFARKSDLDAFGIRIPTLDEPWTGEEFQQVLDTYKDSGKFEFAFDPGMAWTGEWYPYAFSPFLQSFGGDIIDRSTFQTAEGALNGDAAVAWGDWWQKLFTEGYSPGTSQTAGDRDNGFIDGRYGLQWMGDWAAAKTMDALGDDVLFLPAPDFGNGPKIGAGSWQWSVSEHLRPARGRERVHRLRVAARADRRVRRVADQHPRTQRRRPVHEQVEGGVAARRLPGLHGGRRADPAPDAAVPEARQDLREGGIRHRQRRRRAVDPRRARSTRSTPTSRPTTGTASESA